VLIFALGLRELVNTFLPPLLTRVNFVNLAEDSSPNGAATDSASPSPPSATNVFARLAAAGDGSPSGLGLITGFTLTALFSRLDHFAFFFTGGQ
jgi:hypothetical protein